MLEYQNKTMPSYDGENVQAGLLLDIKLARHHLARIFIVQGLCLNGTSILYVLSTLQIGGSVFLDLLYDLLHDLLYINTCGFLQAARESLLQSKKPNAQLVVTGCMFNLHEKEIKSMYPEVNHISERDRFQAIQQRSRRNLYRRNLIDIFESDSRICRYLDMPIRHISNDILKRMKRTTTGDGIRQTIAKTTDKTAAGYSHSHQLDGGVSRRNRRALSRALGL